MQNAKTILVILVSQISMSAFAGGSSTVGPENPSSRFCLDQGGADLTLDIGGFGGDQIGLCRLSDDSMIESWTLFDSKAQKSLAVRNFLRAKGSSDSKPIEGQARRHCVKVGGKVVMATPHLRPSVEFELCQFADQSVIEIWTLFNGPVYYPQLAQLLK